MFDISMIMAFMVIAHLTTNSTTPALESNQVITRMKTFFY